MVVPTFRPLRCRRPAHPLRGSRASAPPRAFAPSGPNVNAERRVRAPQPRRERPIMWIQNDRSMTELAMKHGTIVPCVPSSIVAPNNVAPTSLLECEGDVCIAPPARSRWPSRSSTPASRARSRRSPSTRRPTRVAASPPTSRRSSPNERATSRWRSPTRSRSRQDLRSARRALHGRNINRRRPREGHRRFDVGPPRGLPRRAGYPAPPDLLSSRSKTEP